MDHHLQKQIQTHMHSCKPMKSKLTIILPCRRLYTACEHLYLLYIALQATIYCLRASLYTILIALQATIYCLRASLYTINCPAGDYTACEHL